ncbi:hypothetical protein [Cerasicoccus frondis]|uniref:hypothetical protein n=1 Tax=Cerasicoccus frondis TaxID=490090 RepID=UPI002852D755|nr:hypothetical protein [Cerasicoccus frondis]
MDKINPSEHITENDPVSQAAHLASNWYETEYLTVDDDSQMGWLQAQGWEIYKTYQTGSGEAYRWGLKRRTIKGEKILNDLLADFTSAYNEGRTLNDQRYDDIVSIHAAITDKTQDSLIALEAEGTDYDALVDSLVAGIEADFTTHSTDIGGDLDDYGDSQRTRINTQFNAKVSQARSSLVSRGMFNSTLWNSVESGIERERAVALTDLEDKILLTQTNLKERLYAAKSTMRSKVLAARDRMYGSSHSHGLAREELRTRVIQALTNFMERRTDSYPDLASIAQIASELGAGTVQGSQP